MVAEGCGGGNVGRSGNDGFVMRIVMQLQKQILCGNKKRCSLFDDPGLRSVGKGFRSDSQKYSHSKTEDYKQELLETLAPEPFFLYPLQVSKRNVRPSQVFARSEVGSSKSNRLQNTCLEG